MVNKTHIKPDKNLIINYNKQPKNKLKNNILKESIVKKNIISNKTHNESQ